MSKNGCSGPSLKQNIHRADLVRIFLHLFLVKSNYAKCSFKKRIRQLLISKLELVIKYKVNLKISLITMI